MFNRKKLADFMRENKVTGVELAKRLGVSEGAVRHILSGIRQPSLAMTQEIAEMIGCSVGDLVLEREAVL